MRPIIIGVDAEISYQWHRNGSEIPRATTDAYVIEAAQATDAAVYSLVAANSVGRSSAANALIVKSAAPPVITTQPRPPTVFAGQIATLSVTVTGSQPLTYQWRKNGAELPGATAAALVLPDLTWSDGGSYDVRVANSLGSTNSEAVTLVVNPPVLPVLSNNSPGANPPAPVVGQSLTINPVLIGGSSPFNYQWLKNGTAISGAANPTLTFASVTNGDAGNYSFVVTNLAGSVTSREVSILVGTPTPPSIISQPEGGAIVQGQSILRGVQIGGSPPISYQWYRNSGALVEQRAPFLSIPSAAPEDAGTYYVVASNVAGSVRSADATVTITPAVAPNILAQPTSMVAGVNSSVTLSVQASGSTPLSYFWQKDGIAIFLNRGPSHFIREVGADDVGAYTVTISNAAGSVTSRVATISIAAPAGVTDFSGVYVGKIGGREDLGDVALYVRSDGTGVFLAHLNLIAVRDDLVATNFRLSSQGAFKCDARDPATGVVRPISGNITSGGVAGSIPSLGLIWSATKSTPGAPLAGFYPAPVVTGGNGAAYLIVGGDGRGLLVVQNSAIIEGGSVTLDAAGRIALTTASGAQLSATLAPAGRFVATAAGGNFSSVSANFAGLRDDVPRTDRLANISTRGSAGSSDDALIAGFVLTGAAPRPVLVRAIGPALGAFGVSGSLPDPRLALFRGNTKLAENDNWSAVPTAGETAAAAARVGAFPLASGSTDAALLVTLDPGAYSAQVSSPAGTNGTALVEVYDAGQPATDTTTPRLINIATRGRVVTSDTLIAGVVITGNSPKRVLVRAVGPGLVPFGVTDALADPVLVVTATTGTGGAGELARNDDWASPSTGAATTGEVAAAAVATGAFALPIGSKDACLLLTLQPGNYTAQVLGKNNATGVALIEVYEVTN